MFLPQAGNLAWKAIGVVGANWHSSLLWLMTFQPDNYWSVQLGVDTSLFSGSWTLSPRAVLHCTIGKCASSKPDSFYSFTVCLSQFWSILVSIVRRSFDRWFYLPFWWSVGSFIHFNPWHIKEWLGDIFMFAVVEKGRVREKKEGKQSQNSSATLLLSCSV